MAFYILPAESLKIFLFCSYFEKPPIQNSVGGWVLKDDFILGTELIALFRHGWVIGQIMYFY